jgi:hypothetical protein
VVNALDQTEPDEAAGTDPTVTAPANAPAPAAEDVWADEHEPLMELLLEASPLTTVLYRPPLRALRSDTTGQAVTTAVALLSRPRGPSVLASGLAEWTPRPHILAWRTKLLTRLRHDHRDLLLDVYLTARTRFAVDWDRRIKWAARYAPDPLAIATLQFWAPLAAIEREVSLAALRPLLSGYEQALRNVRRFGLDQAGAA